jgi:hypothetical protein
MIRVTHTQEHVLSEVERSPSEWVTAAHRNCVAAFRFADDQAPGGANDNSPALPALGTVEKNSSPRGTTEPPHRPLGSERSGCDRHSFCPYVFDSSDNPRIFQERWCTPLVVASTADRPGANANPTRPGPATSSDAFPSGVILTIPRLPEREAAT